MASILLILILSSCTKTQEIQIEEIGIKFEIPKEKIQIIQGKDLLTDVNEKKIATQHTIYMRYTKRDLRLSLTSTSYEPGESKAHEQLESITSTNENDKILEQRPDNSIILSRRTGNREEYIRIRLIDHAQTQIILQASSFSQENLTKKEVEDFFSKITFL